MKNPNYVSLQTADSEMVWQSDKSDFVQIEDWIMELHDKQDFVNAINKARDCSYIGKVDFEYNELTAFELSNTK